MICQGFKLGLNFGLIFGEETVDARFLVKTKLRNISSNDVEDNFYFFYTTKLTSIAVFMAKSCSITQFMKPEISKSWKHPRTPTY